MSASSHRVTVERGGQVLAEATLDATPDRSVVHADLHVESGAQPPGVRAELVDAVVDHAVVQPAAELTATLPAGDAEMVTRLRERCQDVEIRSVGATVLANVSPRAAVD